MQVRRLLPHPAEITVDEAIAGLDLGALAPPNRPYLVVNMVASVDGRAALAGRSQGIGQAADREVLHHLRSQADAIMTGAGTLRVEPVGRLVRDRDLAEKRRRGGVRPTPLAVVVSGALDLPADATLLRDPANDVLVVTAAGAVLDVADGGARLDYLRAPAAPFALAPVLATLRGEHGVRSVLCEGGPGLNAALLAEGLVDELFLTVAPKLLGEQHAPTIIAGLALPEPAALELVWVLEAEGELFLRYRLRR